MIPWPYSCIASRSRARPGKVGRPVVHQPSAPFEQVGARIRRLHLVGDHVRQRSLDNLARVVGPLGGPVPETRPEAVRNGLVNGNRKPHICGNRKLHTSGEDVSGGADILPVMPVGRVGLDAGSGATGVLANTRREAAEPAVTWRLPHAVRPTLSSASADAPASGNCCPGC